MIETTQQIEKFVAYAKSLKGDEKGEAQVFCDRLFQAFGHAGYKEAGATLEDRLKRSGKGTGFVDLLWRPRLLLEMKSSKEKLQRHYQQAFEYWLNATPNRPKYVVLCNFKEFWIYDFNFQLHEPVDRVALDELPDRYTALNFMFPKEREPLFNNDRVAVTRDAANSVAEVFNAIIRRGEDRERAQRFILQCVVAMFSEDFDLLPKGIFTELLNDCGKGESTYDLLGNLFRQMDTKAKPRGGRYSQVDYFNGGLFQTIDPIELTADEVELLSSAASEKWSKVAPPIFGTLFQSSMDSERRHAYGAHFTSEADIQKIVLPTIVRPWRERIAATTSLRDLRALGEELLKVRVLDPACGSGNFLYIAYRELMNLEMEILAKIHENFGVKARRAVGTASLVSTKQFFGIDKDPFAVELAKVTLMLGKRIALSEVVDSWFPDRLELPFQFESPLPLDNLDENIREGDALFVDWPKVDFIIGNPPYQSKNKMQEEYGRDYLNKVAARFPEMSGMADFCVYWFRKAHDHLSGDARAGMVGTNTIRQTYSRVGGLDYIVQNDGTIYDAVSTQVWSGDAVVHVSIVNWKKGPVSGQKQLATQLGNDIDSPWKIDLLDRIPSSLTAGCDVTQAVTLQTNATSDVCNQGQTPGHEGFLLTPEEAFHSFNDDSRNAEVLYSYLTGDDLLSSSPPKPSRYIVDFHPRDVTEAASYRQPFARVKKAVLPTREAAAKEEEKRNEKARENNPKARVNKHHGNFLKRWWLFSYPREELVKRISTLSRYVACSRVTSRPVFAFVRSSIRPSDALQVFCLEDDYSFGILQSSAHWQWFTARCSTLKGDNRYTSNTVFDSFPWPQSPNLKQVKKIAETAVALRTERARIMAANNWTLRELYRTLEMPGENPLKAAQKQLDSAVRSAYGMSAADDELFFLLSLGQVLGEKEKAEESIVSPGLPPCVADKSLFITHDAVEPLRYLP